MSDNPDPAANVDLRAKLIAAATRQASPSRIDKGVVGGDRARVIKMIIGHWGLSRGDYVPDAPTNDELVNLCIATGHNRQAHWMLYMGRTRSELNLAQLIKKPVTKEGLPSRQIQVIENDLTGPAWDTYKGLRISNDMVGLIVRIGKQGLFVYSKLNITPVGSGSVSFCLGDPHDQDNWRSIFPLEGLMPSEPE